ncbi:MAG: hypothetical protein HQK79_05925 [Desulfobacterales bacterium]|nr:hypothetical protein [Desulfobacterales bacterium]
MDKNTLLKQLEIAFKIVFCEQIKGDALEQMQKSVEGFFREGINHYTFEEVIEQFTPPTKGVNLFLEYIKAKDELNYQTKH